MKIAVIYKSFLGSTKKYSYWIAEEYNADVYTFGKVTEDILQSYDVIVIASGTYASTMPLTGFLKKYWDVLKTKKVIAVAVGMAPAENQQSLAQYELIPSHIQDEIHYFKLPGKLIKAGSEGEPSKEKLNSVFETINKML